ncbi:MAG TPA: UDP-3-O-(3-hydroxymyristoyl)glucosamine N-acyltransferase [Trueperaceae bacterium]
MPGGAPELSPREVADVIGGHLSAGTGSVTITHLASVERLSRGYPEAGSAVVVVPSAQELSRLAAAPALPGLLVLGEDAQPQGPLAELPLVRVGEPRLALARLSAVLDTRPRPFTGEISAAAHVHPDARLGTGVTLAAGSFVGQDATVGDGSYLGPGASVGAGAVIGADCVLHAGVTVYDGVKLGDRVVLHAGAVIGADGFGYAPSPAGAVKIRQLGGVRLEDDVEIGANTAIDRGTLDDTVVGARTKIDNLCQVGHNVVIGSDCLIAGMTGIAGSARVGAGVIIGGAVAVSDHVSIGSGARIAGRSGVTKDVPAGETWAGFPARPHRQYARSLYLLERLEDVWRAVKRMERD